MNFRANFNFYQVASLVLLFCLLGITLYAQNLNHNTSNSDTEKEVKYSKSFKIKGQTAIFNGNGNSADKQSMENLISFANINNVQNIQINEGPGTIIENQIFDGVNITLINSPNSIIRGNTITNIVGNIVYGIYIVNSSDTFIQNNIISELTGTVDVYGIYVRDSVNLVIEDNDIFGLTTSDGRTIGIYETGVGSTIIRGNNIGQLIGDYVSGIELYLDGGSDLISSNLISSFNGQQLTGILSVGSNHVLIELNSITKFATSSVGRSFFGMALVGNDFIISNNIINDLSVSGQDKVFGYGIAVSGERFTILNNTVSNLNVETTIEYANVYGFYIEFAIDSNNFIADNSVSFITGNGATIANVFGIYFYRSSNFNVEFNSISNILGVAPNGIVEEDIFLLESNLGTFNFVEGSTNAISWSHDGLVNYNQFYLYIDNVNIDANSWIDGPALASTKIKIDTDLPVGLYTYTILIIDTVIVTTPITDTIRINIIPVFVPTLVYSLAPSVELGTKNNFVIWEFIDNNPSFAEIYVNNALVVNSTWNSGQAIMYNLDNLGQGEYNFSIYVYDSEGNSNNNTVVVIVDDTLLPNIVLFSEEFVEQEIVVSNITWYLADLNPSIFRLFANGTEILNGTWQNEVPIIFSLYDWDLGLTNFTIEVEDQFGQTTRSTVNVNVVDTLEPILNEPIDFFFNEGELNINLEWIAEDFNPGNWTLYENGVNYQNGTWDSKIPITVNLDQYKWGKYNFTLFVHDIFGNTVADTVIVNIFLPSDHTYTQNAATKSTSQNIFEDINPLYLAAGGVVVGVATIGSVLRRRRGL